MSVAVVIEGAFSVGPVERLTQRELEERFQPGELPSQKMPDGAVALVVEIRFDGPDWPKLAVVTVDEKKRRALSEVLRRFGH